MKNFILAVLTQVIVLPNLYANNCALLRNPEYGSFPAAVVAYANHPLSPYTIVTPGGKGVVIIGEFGSYMLPSREKVVSIRGSNNYIDITGTGPRIPHAYEISDYGSYTVFRQKGSDFQRFNGEGLMPVPYQVWQTDGKRVELVNLLNGEKLWVNESQTEVVETATFYHAWDIRANRGRILYP